MIWPFSEISRLKAERERLQQHVLTLQRVEGRLRRENGELHSRLRTLQAQLRETTKSVPPRTIVRPFPWITKEEVARQHVEDWRKKVEQAQRQHEITRDLQNYLPQEDVKLMDSMAAPLGATVTTAMHEGES